MPLSPTGSCGAASKECENVSHDGGGGDTRPTRHWRHDLSRAGCLVGMEHGSRPAAVGLYAIS